MPENVIACRLGGDEFCFTIPDLSLEETRKLKKQIHSDLSSNDKVMGLDITFGACNFTQFDNISELIKKYVLHIKILLLSLIIFFLKKVILR